MNTINLATYLIFLTVGGVGQPYEQEVYRYEYSDLGSCIDVSSTLNKTFRETGTYMFTKCLITGKN
jgi:uncharacterized membrane protein